MTDKDEKFIPCRHCKCFTPITWAACCVCDKPNMRVIPGGLISTKNPVLEEIIPVEDDDDRGPNCA